MCGGGCWNEKEYEKNKRIWKILAIDYFHGFSTKGTCQLFPEENNEKLRELNTFQVKILPRSLVIRKWFQKISYFSFREPESSTFGYTFFKKVLKTVSVFFQISFWSKTWYFSMIFLYWNKIAIHVTACSI